MVQLGQKELLIDMQGNWGNIYTGDGAAASRYIEARLSGFANDVVFNPKTTEWKLSYDGRNKEPVTLPVKFPLLLAQGAEGIAVGLSSKILPHNFNELIDASIRYLQGKDFELYPDFPTGGLAEFSKYNDGLRGGSIKVRARIEKLDNKTLVIKELPFGKTTTTLIDSIIKAAEKGKIKIKKIDDNTAEFVEILVHLGPNISSDKTIDSTEWKAMLTALKKMNDYALHIPLSHMLNNKHERKDTVRKRIDEIMKLTKAKKIGRPVPHT